MSLLTLILAIISFIFSFIPLFGIAITFIGALFCIVFIMLLLKDKEKRGSSYINNCYSCSYKRFYISKY